jgi:hypothetical protein
MAGQPTHLAAWQKDRHAQKRAQIRDALRRLDSCGVAITFATVADEAGVDRSWIYSQSDLAGEIKRLRDETTGPLKPRPQRERASEASLHVRLAAAQQTNADQSDEIKQLRDEVRALRDEIGRLRGERWENHA